MALTPLVCLPGLLGDARIFEPFARLARRSREVHCLDLPPGPPRQAARELDLPRGSFHVLTGSYGGLVARCLPPERMLSLACVATLPDRSLCPRSVELQSRMLARMPSTLVERLYARRLDRVLAEDGVRSELADRLHRLDRDTLVGRLRGVLDWDLPPQPQVPTLWVLGATDPMAPWSVGEILRWHPHVQACHVPGGHRPYASHPGPLLTRLQGFWSEAGASSLDEDKQHR